MVRTSQHLQMLLEQSMVALQEGERSVLQIHIVFERSISDLDGKAALD